MSNHLSEDEATRYRQRLSPPDELLRTDEHIARCNECRRRVADGLSLISVLQRRASTGLALDGACQFGSPMTTKPAQ